jgi:hypothetical protein
MSWIQFTVADGEIQAITSAKVSDLELAMLGRAQIETSSEVNRNKYRVDVSQFPPQVISR